MRFFLKRYIHILCIVFVAIICYCNSFDAPFSYDSIKEIPENPSIRNLDNYLSLNAFKASRYFGYLTFAIDYKIAGLSVFQYHLTNLIIHIINGILVYFLVLFTAKTQIYSNNNFNDLLPNQYDDHKINLIALFSALIFISHPLQTQSVTYIVQRNTSLATTFYLLSLVMYINGRILIAKVPSKSNAVEFNHNSRNKMYLIVGTYFLLSIIFGLFSMRTKELSATLPISILLYELFFFKVVFKKRILVFLSLLLIILIGPFVIFYGKGLSAKELITWMLHLRELTDIPKDAYIFTQFRVMVTYIRLIFLPINQSLDYDYPVFDTFFALPVFLSFIFLSSLLVLAIYLYVIGRKNNSLPEKIISYGIVWFFITLLPYTVIPIVDLVIEHRLYLPLAGVSMALAFGSNVIFEQIQKKWHVTNQSKVILASSIIIILSIATLMRNHVWGSEIRLWQDVLEKHPYKLRGYRNLVDAYIKYGKYREAITTALEIIDVAPEKEVFYYNIGYSLFKLGRFEDAKVALEHAIITNKSYVRAYSTLAAVYLHLKDYKKALEVLKEEIRLSPTSSGYNNFGVAYFHLNMIDDAISAYKKSLELDPNNKEASLNLQNALNKKNTR